MINKLESPKLEHFLLTMIYLLIILKIMKISKYLTKKLDKKIFLLIYSLDLLKYIFLKNIKDNNSKKSKMKIKIIFV